MKLIAQVKLQPTPEQADALKRTLETANAAANYVSGQAWETQTFRQYDLHHLCYSTVREQFGLSAQVTVRVLAKVADAYKLDRKAKRVFRLTGGIAYDDRILSWKLPKLEVSIWTVDGRLRVPFVAGERQRQMLETRQGESDLVLVRDEWYLLAVCEVEEPTPHEVQGVLGVDLGIVNLATDSDGQTFSGAAVERTRQHYDRLRRSLQKVGTKSAKRKLKRLSGRERRFKSNTNHVISKRLVAKAKDTRQDLALEDLTGIRERTEPTVRKTQRSRHSKWAFGELRQYIAYKAALAGVRLHLVDPRNTSRACHACGCIDKRNRPDQATFKCVACGHSSNADCNAARNIRARALVNAPMVAPLSVAVTSQPL